MLEINKEYTYKEICEELEWSIQPSNNKTKQKQIKTIEENGGETLLDDKTKEALDYRKKYPEASLKELAEIISLETGKPITKSGLNHRMRKIKDLATRLKKGN